MFLTSISRLEVERKVGRGPELPWDVSAREVEGRRRE